MAVWRPASVRVRAKKLQEQYLALQLTKSMDRKLILTNYLNTINLGNNALGVKVAARRYF